MKRLFYLIHSQEVAGGYAAETKLGCSGRQCDACNQQIGGCTGRPPCFAGGPQAWLDCPCHNWGALILLQVSYCSKFQCAKSVYRQKFVHIFRGGNGNKH